MNKNTFLKELEKKLFVLNESERNDIINEYRDVIEEKEKHGKTEKEALDDFGDMDTLVKEILSAYKINPDFSEKAKKKDDESFDDFIKSADKFIKKAADWLSDFTRNLVEGFRNNGHDITIEAIFEIVLKVIVILFLLMIPFSILRGMGEWISSMMVINSLSHIINFFWQLLISALYFVAAIIVVSSTMKNVLDRDNNKVEKHKKEPLKKNNSTNAENKQETNITNERHSDFMSVIVTIVKIVVVIWTLPFVFMTGMTYFGLVILIYLLTKGLFLYGLIILAIGVTSLLTYILTVIYTILFTNKKIHFYPVIIYIFIIALGSIMTTDYFINLNYYDKVPANQYEIKTDRIEKDITKDVYFINYSVENVVVDNTLADNKMIIELSYYKDFIKYNLNITDETCASGDAGTSNVACNRYYIGTTDIRQVNWLVNNFIENLKNNEVYSYQNIYHLNIKVSVNQNTLAKIK